MKSLYIASTEGSGGKTTLSVGLCLALRARGLDVGYFKPVGIVPHDAAGELVDDDARFVAEVLGLDTPLTDLCPVVLDEGALHEVLAGSDVDTLARVASAFERVERRSRPCHLRGLGRDLAGPFPAGERGRRGGPSRSARDHRRPLRRRPPARRCLLRQGRPQRGAAGRDLQHGPGVASCPGARRVRRLPRRAGHPDLRGAAGQPAARRGDRLRDRRGPGRDLLAAARSMATPWPRPT